MHDINSENNLKSCIQLVSFPKKEETKKWTINHYFLNNQIHRHDMVGALYSDMLSSDAK